MHEGALLYPPPHPFPHHSEPPTASNTNATPTSLLTTTSKLHSHLHSPSPIPILISIIYFYPNHIPFPLPTLTPLSLPSSPLPAICTPDSFPCPDPYKTITCTIPKILQEHLCLALTEVPEKACSF